MNIRQAVKQLTVDPARPLAIREQGRIVAYLIAPQVADRLLDLGVFEKDDER